MGEPGTGETLGEKSAMALHAEQAGAVLFGWGKSLREKMAAAASKVKVVKDVLDTPHAPPPTRNELRMRPAMARARRLDAPHLV